MCVADQAEHEAGRTLASAKAIGHVVQGKSTTAGGSGPLELLFPKGLDEPRRG